MLQGGFTVAELREAKFSADDIKSAGATPKELKEGGFSAEWLKDDEEEQGGKGRPQHGEEQEDQAATSQKEATSTGEQETAAAANRPWPPPPLEEDCRRRLRLRQEAAAAREALRRERRRKQVRPLTPPPPAPPPARPPTAAPRLPPPPRGPAPPPPREGRWDRAADASLSEEDCPALRAANLEPELYSPPPGLKERRRRPRGKPKQIKKLPYWQTRLATAAEKVASPELKADLRALGRGGEPALRAAAKRLGWNQPWALLACLLARARAAGATTGSDPAAAGASWDSLLGAALGVLLGLVVLWATLRCAPRRRDSSRRRPPDGPKLLASTRGLARKAGRQRLRGLRAYTRAALRRREAAAERRTAELALLAC